MKSAHRLVSEYYNTPTKTAATTTKYQPLPNKSQVSYFSFLVSWLQSSYSTFNKSVLVTIPTNVHLMPSHDPDEKPVSHA